jgi:hypothetical protein
MSALGPPLFIGGLAHSGKTPVRLVLDHSDEIVITRKSYLWLRYFNRLGDLGDPSDRAAALDTVLADPSVRRLMPDGARVRREFESGPHSYARLFGILHDHHAERAGRPRWGEQLGLVEAFADAIFDAFPAARIVHMIRDPRDRISAHGSSSPGRTGWETAKWLYSARLARDNARRHPDRYCIVQYEHLVAEPRATMQAVCDFAGLSMNASMVDAAEVIADRGHRKHVASTRRNFVEAQAATALTELGYATRPAGAGRFASSVGAPFERLGAVAFRTTKQRSLARQTGAR